MKNLIYKDLKLNCDAKTYGFMAFALMLLIPSYPYYVAFFYSCMSIFFMFLSGRENKDVEFSAMLPVRRCDIVRARCAVVVIIELANIIAAVPVAVVNLTLSQMRNAAGIEPNPAFFGLVFVMFAIFNAIFLPAFYKTAYKAGRAFLISSIVMAVFVVAAETLVHVGPAKEYLDAVGAQAYVSQIPVLFCGMAVFAVMTWVGCKSAEKRFERVDL